MTTGKSEKSKKKFQPFRWLTAPYRLVVIDEQNLQEVGSYRLKKVTLYMAVSTLVIITALLTIALIVFTNIKYYLPGYNSDIKRQELISIKKRADSLYVLIAAQQRQYNRIATVLKGDFTGVRDTNLIDMDRLRNEKLKSYFPDADSIKKDALENLQDKANSSDSNGKKSEPKLPQRK